MSVEVTFSSGSTSRTVTVMAEDDTVIENDETFTLSLTSDDDAVDVMPQSATVTITDQTSKYSRIEECVEAGKNLYQCLFSLNPPSLVTIGFTQTEYTVMEGGTVDVTVSVMEGTPSDDVVVTVTSHDVTASML